MTTSEDKVLELMGLADDFASADYDSIAAARSTLESALRAVVEDAMRWQWARASLLSASFVNGRHKSGEFNYCPIGEANTSSYWDEIADRARKGEKGGG
jgi:hypothetical protein